MSRPSAPSATAHRRPVSLVALITAVATAVALLPAADANADDLIDHGDRGRIADAVPGEQVEPLVEPISPEPAPPAAATDPVPSGSDTGGGFTTADRHDGGDSDGGDDDAEAFAFRTTVRTTGKIAPDIQIRGGGWGHGVGMSQYGAFAQALEGRSATQILTHYYPGTQVTTDTRSTDNRIRAGVQINQRSSPIRALDGTVTWRVCTPSSDPGRNGRVPGSRCADWSSQPAGQQLRVLPLPAGGVVTPTGTQSTVDGELVTVGTDGAVVGDASGPAAGSDPATDGTTTRVPAPRGGILIELSTSNGWVAHRAYRTPTTGTIASDQLPVARANHGDDRIEAQSYGTGAFVYGFGWRDFHLTGTPDSPDTHRLAIVQDVSSVERYLRGLAEVPNSWPTASLEAQAIAGRTFALRGSRGGGCLCDKLSTAADQVFIGESKVEAADGGRWAGAVAATEQQVLTFETATQPRALAETFYSSSHGGRTENVEDSWAYGTVVVPYLRSQDDPWSLLSEVNGTTITNPRRNWVAATSNNQMAGFLSAGQPTPIVRVERIQVRNRTEGGTPRELRVTGATSTGQRITFDTRLESQYAKGIAGGAMRRSLPLVEGGESNGRISSSQIRRFGFGPFTDDDATTHEYAITWAATAGVVQGVGADRFAPNRDVTRAQMATFLNNAFALPSAPIDADTFPDVTPGSTHHAAIEAIAAAGITVGYGDGTYQPGEPVTRAEMATFLARAMALRTDTTGTFGDVRVGSTHAAAIEAVAAEAITQGCTATTFCPADPVSRGQLASFVERAVNR